MTPPAYEPLFQLAPDTTEYRRLDGDFVHVEKTSIGEFLIADPEALRLLVEEAFRDRAWEEILLKTTQDSLLGAQFGGKYLALDARVVRLPRHAGSCPVSIGVSCSADRNIKALINRAEAAARPRSVWTDR